MAATSSLEPGGLVRLLSWRRVLFTLAISAFLGLLLTIPSVSPARVVVTRAVVVGLITMLTFGLLERWPSRLPAWLARWALLEAARQIGRRAHLVFVTAYDKYAVQAFDQGALDYILKPVDPARLADTANRLRERLRTDQAPVAIEELLEPLLQQLTAKLQKNAAPAPLRWIRAAVGQSLRLIPVDEIDFLRSDEKYTLVAWRGDAGRPSEALVRMPLKELLPKLDTSQFAQVHRSVVVNLRAISHVTRGLNETADIHLKGRSEILPASRSYLHLFRHM
jgi:DNA-binding LytR/AlgR family response regulator